MFSLEKPVPDEEMLSNRIFIQSIFLELATNNKELVHDLIFNWLCLVHGAISIIMKNPSLPNQGGKDPRDIFVNMINRFVNSL